MMNNTHNQGFSLLLTLLVSSVALAIGLVLLNLTMKQLDLATSSRESEVAFQSARAGMDCLQYLRYKNPEFADNNPSVSTLECYGETLNLSDQQTGNQVLQVYQGEFDWVPEGETDAQCIMLEMYIYNTNADAVTSDIAMNQAAFSARGIVGETCTDGDICTIGFAQGYNRSCAESTNSLYTVQRELTAEF